jgi:drug/metabolite transporter (DMT)-like permease
MRATFGWRFGLTFGQAAASAAPQARMRAMTSQDRIDSFGALALTGFAALLAFNQVVIAVVNDGLQPVFFAALRSLGGVVCLLAWMRYRAIPLSLPPGTAGPGLLMGVLFALEFICLFVALDLTTVTRAAILFYSMPVWLAVISHLTIRGAAITRASAIGLGLAFGGVVLALALRGDAEGQGSLVGDVCALAAALAWAGIAALAKASRLRILRPEMQLVWQLGVSVPVLAVAAFAFGPFLRDPGWIHWAGLAFQIIVIVFIGFLLWLWLLSIYPAASVAAFSFLSPVFGVVLGWLLLGERVGPEIVVALGLVVAGLILINRPGRV